MATDLIFDMFHRYNRLVRRELVQPLKHSCGTPFVTGLGSDDELVLACIACDTTVRPGADTIRTVNAVVKEHYLDD